MTPTVGSLFTGIGGFDLGLERAGFRIAWQAEVDPYCSEVLRRHWPEVPNLGDVRNVGACEARAGRRSEPRDAAGASVQHERGGALRRAPDTVDLICGGFPCQDVSVAGKRAGLDGERSGLWFEFKRILSELRPAYALIENVPGLLSSNQGRDFAIVLDGLVECGFGGVGWRVLDSQFFGVPQRRRRVFIVAGPTREGVEQILSLCESCGGNPETGGETGEDVAYALAASVRGTGDGHGNAWNSTYIPDVAGALGQTLGHHRGALDLDGHGAYIAHTLRAEGFDASEDGTGRGTPVVAVRTAQTSSNGWGVNEDGTAYTLDGAQGQAVVTSTVRRLTPVECARLQGFPDDWCHGKDGPQYRAYGNAVTVPVIEYLGLRLRSLIEGAA